MLEDLGSKLRAHTTKGSLCTALVQNFIVTVGLYDGHIVLLLVSTNLTANTHTLSQEIHQLVVQLINLTTQLMQTFSRIMLITNHQETQDVIQNLRSNLLLSITPSIIRLAVTLHDQAIKTKVHCLLTKWSDQITTTTDMAWVTDDRQLWNAAMQLNRNLPHRKISINLFIKAGETTMDSTQLLDTSLIDTLESTDPQLQIRVYRVFHQYRYIHAFQTVSKRLHRKRIGRSTCTNP